MPEPTARQRFIAVKALAKILTDEVRFLKERVEQEMIADDIERRAVRDGAGRIVGRLSISGGTTKARVADERKLLEWVAANHPEQLKQIVHESYVKRLLEDAEAGEEPAPGVKLYETTRYVSATDIEPMVEQLRSQPFARELGIAPPPEAE